MNHHDDQPGDQREHPAPEGVEGLSAQQGQTGPQAMPEGAGSRALAEALKTSFLFLKIAITALVLIYVVKTGVFTVKSSQVALKLRFGRLVRSGGDWVMKTGSGIHFRWPFESIEQISTDEKKLELQKAFWPAAKLEDVQQAPWLDVRNDGYLLTGDANIVHMKLRARYRVRDDTTGAVAYKFGIRDAEGVLRRAFQAATVKVVGSMKVMDVLKRKGLFSAIRQELDSRLNRFEKQVGMPLGIELITVESIETEKVKNPTEPGPVSAAFEKAQNASSQSDSLAKQGETRKKEIVSQAEAMKAGLVAAARGYSERLVRSAQVDARVLERLLPIYEHSPGERNILVAWFYERAITQILTDSPGAFVLHGGSGDTRHEIRLMMNRLPPPSSKKQATQNQMK
ncbi:MAG: hypothetical protein J7M08_10105 [Planctomycetes bacterium]|nr:hypothetical protein [Planctomycetota bacterium]